MRYCTWRLAWSDGYGYGPEKTAHENGSKLEASMWVSPDVESGTILGYLTGDVDISILSDFEAQELTEAEALAFATAIDENAYLLEDGIIGTTTTLEML